MKKRILSLDIIRLIAMMLIIMFHWNIYCVYLNIQTPEAFYMIFASGNIANIGVSLFFILSGASLMYSYRDKLVMKSYLKKRFLSIYPLYWVCYIVFFIRYYVVDYREMTAPKSTFILSFLGMDGFMNYWSPNYYLMGEWFVGCIVLIYLLFPLLRRCVIKYPVATAVITVCLYIPYIYFYPFKMDISHFPLTRVPEVMFGMYFVNISYSSRRLEENTAGCNALWGIPALICLGIAVFLPIKLPIAYLNIYLGVSSFLVLNWVFKFAEKKEYFFQKPIIWLAGYSYPIFLIHHVLMADALVPFAGGSVSLRHNYFLFARHCLFILGFSIVLTAVSRRIVKFFSVRKEFQIPKS